MVVYENQSGESIVYFQMPVTDGMNYDTEDAQVKRIPLGGQEEALVITKNGRTCVIWHNAEFLSLGWLPRERGLHGYGKSTRKYLLNCTIC